MHHLDLNEANLLIWHAKHSSKVPAPFLASRSVPFRHNWVPTSDCLIPQPPRLLTVPKPHKGAGGRETPPCMCVFGSLMPGAVGRFRAQVQGYWGNVCPARARRATFLLTIPTSTPDLPSHGEAPQVDHIALHTFPTKHVT